MHNNWQSDYFLNIPRRTRINARSIAPFSPFIEPIEFSFWNICSFQRVFSSLTAQRIDLLVLLHVYSTHNFQDSVTAHWKNLRH